MENESELRRNTSVTHATCDPLLIDSRPSVIYRSTSRREFGLPTIVQDAHSSNSIHSTTSACLPHSYADRFRLSGFDFQDLQQRPFVLSGRPFHLTSYLVDPRDPAQKLQEMNDIPVLFSGCQGSGNSQCTSIREGAFSGFCCQEDLEPSEENYEIAFGRGKRRKMPLSCPDQTIQKPVFPGQQFGTRPNYQYPEGSTSSFCDELEVSPSSETQVSFGLGKQGEVQEDNDEEEKGEQEEQLKEFSYEVVEPHVAKYCTPVSRDGTSGRFDEEYYSHSALLSSVDRRESESEINGTFQRKENETGQTNQKHGHPHCRNLCYRAPTSNLQHRHEDMSRNNTNYAKSEMERRAEDISTYWTPNRQGGVTCLVCFKTLKRSYYMKSHLLIHTGGKPHKCAYCSKSFKQVGNRNAHQRIHTGEKPYACEYCGKKFIFNSARHNHMKIHKFSEKLKGKCGRASTI